MRNRASSPQRGLEERGELALGGTVVARVLQRLGAPQALLGGQHEPLGGAAGRRGIGPVEGELTARLLGHACSARGLGAPEQLEPLGGRDPMRGRRRLFEELQRALAVRGRIAHRGDRRQEVPAGGERRHRARRLEREHPRLVPRPGRELGLGLEQVQRRRDLWMRLCGAGERQRRLGRRIPERRDGRGRIGRGRLAGAEQENEGPSGVHGASPFARRSVSSSAAISGGIGDSN